MRTGKTHKLSKTAERDFAEWDAEIEAEFQRVVRTSKAAGKAKRGRRHVGFPLAFLVDVCRSIDGYSAAPLVVAMLIYRRTIVCKACTVTLPGKELADLRIDRAQKLRALTKLQKAGLVRIERDRLGRSARVTLLWRAGWTVSVRQR
jgi:hypothetical protein